jgi:hypothetical protein
MLKLLKQLYLRIGIHAAPRGTALYYLNSIVLGAYYALIPRRRIPSPPGFPAPHWYRIVETKRRLPVVPAGASPLHFREMLERGEHVEFDLDWAINHGGARGLALVFFMGMGDYFLITPVVAEIKRLYPQVPLHAYVSTLSDKNNSPLVGELMAHNPHIDRIVSYNGRRDQHYDVNWRNYNYEDVFTTAPRDFLTVPIIYEYHGGMRHRVLAAFETFGLRRLCEAPRPLIHLPKNPSAKVLALIETIRQKFKDLRRKGIVVLQLEARSSDYAYPYADELAENLCRQGYMVVSFSPLTVRDEACLVIDIKQCPITDSIYLLKLLAAEFGDAFSLLTVVSVFWAVSAGLQIRNIGMQHFYDEAVHNVWYPNIHVISHFNYPAIPEDRLCLAAAADFALNDRQQADFKPAFVLRCFEAAMGRDMPQLAKQDDASLSAA